MPLRLGPKGGVAKPSSSTKVQRPARPPASNVIDLTRESTNETSLEGSREGSAQAKRNEYAPARYDEGNRDGKGGHRNSGAGTQERAIGARQATAGRPQIDNDHRVARPAQGFVFEYSYIVTSLYHEPWGMGDTYTVIGLFSTEMEAKGAAYKDFHQRCKSQQDGWEHKWGHHPGDGTLQLHGYCEDGEVDQYRYTASFKCVQQERAAAMPQNIPIPAPPTPSPVQPRYVYVVKEEQRENVGADDPQGFYNEEGDLKEVNIHGIYVDLEDANEDAREQYETIVEDFRDDAETITDDFEDGMAIIAVADPLEEMTYSISVERRMLR